MEKEELGVLERTCTVAKRGQSMEANLGEHAVGDILGLEVRHVELMAKNEGCVLVLLRILYLGGVEMFHVCLPGLVLVRHGEDFAVKSVVNSVVKV